MSSDISENPFKKKKLPPQKVTAIMPNGEVLPIDNLTKFMKKHDMCPWNVQKMKMGKYRSVKKIILIWGELTDEKIKKAMESRPHPHAKKKRFHKKRKTNILKPKTLRNPLFLEEGFDFTDWFFKRKIYRFIFTSPETGKRYQVVARNRRHAVETLKLNGLIPQDKNYTTYLLDKHFVSDMCDRIIAPNLPLLIWREYDISMLKKFGFRIGKEDV